MCLKQCNFDCIFLISALTTYNKVFIYTESCICAKLFFNVKNINLIQGQQQLVNNSKFGLLSFLLVNGPLWYAPKYCIVFHPLFLPWSTSYHILCTRFGWSERSHKTYTLLGQTLSEVHCVFVETFEACGSLWFLSLSSTEKKAVQTMFWHSKRPWSFCGGVFESHHSSVITKDGLLQVREAFQRLEKGIEINGDSADK